MRSKFRLPLIAALALAGCASGSAGVAPKPVAAAAVEPTAEHCADAVQAARRLAEALPKDDVSRRAAESFLVQAKVEAGNGEFDDCLEMAAHAEVEVREHRYRLLPGEKLESHPAE